MIYNGRWTRTDGVSFRRDLLKRCFVVLDCPNVNVGGACVDVVGKFECVGICRAGRTWLILQQYILCSESISAQSDCTFTYAGIGQKYHICTCTRNSNGVSNSAEISESGDLGENGICLCSRIRNGCTIVWKIVAGRPIARNVDFAARQILCGKSFRAYRRCSESAAESDCAGIDTESRCKVISGMIYNGCSVDRNGVCRAVYIKVCFQQIGIACVSSAESAELNDAVRLCCHESSGSWSRGEHIMSVNVSVILGAWTWKFLPVEYACRTRINVAVQTQRPSCGVVVICAVVNNADSLAVEHVLR